MASGLIKLQVSTGTNEPLGKDKFSCLPCSACSMLLYMEVVGLGRRKQWTWTLCCWREGQTWKGFSWSGKEVPLQAWSYTWQLKRCFYPNGGGYPIPLSCTRIILAVQILGSGLEINVSDLANVADVSVFLEWYVVFQVPEERDAKKHHRTQQEGSAVTWHWKVSGLYDGCALQGKLQSWFSGLLFTLKSSLAAEDLTQIEKNQLAYVSYTFCMLFNMKLSQNRVKQPIC